MNIRPEDPPPVRKALKQVHGAPVGQMQRFKRELVRARADQLRQEVDQQPQQDRK